MADANEEEHRTTSQCCLAGCVYDWNYSYSSLTSSRPRSGHSNSIRGSPRCEHQPTKNIATQPSMVGCSLFLAETTIYNTTHVAESAPIVAHYRRRNVSRRLHAHCCCPIAFILKPIGRKAKYGFGSSPRRDTYCIVVLTHLTTSRASGSTASSSKRLHMSTKPASAAT